MRKKIWCLYVILLVSCTFLSPIIPAMNNEHEYMVQDPIYSHNKQHNTFTSPMTLMPVYLVEIMQWEKDYQAAQKTLLDPSLNNIIAATEDYSILDLLKYTPRERDQHWCGNCWAWPATAILEIALNVQEGIYDRLSVQYINSCGSIVGVGCCEGGNLNLFSQFYRRTDKAIPWSNENAQWIDKFAQCTLSCESIETEPFYPISAVYPMTIETQGVSEETAIENIKNVLHQQKGVYFAWYLPNQEYLDDFHEFWNDYDEEDIYDLDWACGTEFDEEDGAGHAVLCVGYHDEEGMDNDYWILLNSWGAPSRRPNGLFRANMHMDYECALTYQGYDFSMFLIQTLDVDFGTEEESPTPPSIQGPTSGKVGETYSYEFSSVDFQDDQIYLMIDWGDEEITKWLGPFDSGDIIEKNHMFSQRDSYFIRARAKDTHDQISLWANLEVTISKQKTLSISLHALIQQFLEQFH